MAEGERPKKRRKLPAVSFESTASGGASPSGSLAKTEQSQIPDTEDAAGSTNRPRKQPHIEGQWASFVYIEIEPTKQFVDLVNRIIDFVPSFPSTGQPQAAPDTEDSTPESHRQLCGESGIYPIYRPEVTPGGAPSRVTESASQQVGSSTQRAASPSTSLDGSQLTDTAPPIPLGPSRKNQVTPFHISLSRPLYPLTHQLKPLRDGLRAAFTKWSSRLPSDRRSADGGPQVAFARFTRFENPERTREFLAVEVGSGFEELKALSDTVDGVLSPLKLPTYHENPRFHTSIAFANLPPADGGPSGPPSQEGRFGPDLLGALNERFGKELRNVRIHAAPIRVGQPLVSTKGGVGMEVREVCVNVSGKEVERIPITRNA